MGMGQRLQNLITWLRNNNIDSAFITLPSNIFYLSGFFTDPHERLLGLAVFQDTEPFLICPKMEVSEVKNADWSHEIIGYNDTDDPWSFVQNRSTARIKSLQTLAIEKDHLSVNRYEALQARFPQASFVPADALLNELRLIKDDEEIKLLKEACRLVDQAIEVGVKEIEEDKTELEIIAKIEYEVKKWGADMAFSPLVLTGANAASPHGTPGKTKIKKGDFVLFDLGVIYKGYCSDITRTVAFGKISEEQEAIYQVVLEAQEAAIQAVKVGEPVKTLDQTARHIIHDKGYGNYFPHRLGHGLGISVHEYPSITETNDLKLEAGMVFTIEPGIYIEGVAGVRIEDDILVTDRGVEMLTNYQKSLQFIK